MATQGFINVLKVTNMIKSTNFNGEILKEILNNENIRYDIVEYEDGWLINVDCPSRDVIAAKNFGLPGRIDDERYYLVFENSQVPFPGRMEVPTVNQDSTGKAEAKILVPNIPPGTTREELEHYFEKEFGGKVQYCRIEDHNATIAFFDAKVANMVTSKAPLSFKGKRLKVFKDHFVYEDEESFENSGAYGGGESEEIATRDTHRDSIELPATEEIPKLPPQSDQRTIVVYGVPESVRKETVEIYFKNPRSPKGGKITYSDFCDRDNGIKITFASSQVAKNVVAKKDHKIDGHPLTVSMCMMEEKQVLISDIKHGVSDDTLKHFLEEKTDLDVENVKSIRPGVWLVYFAGKIDFEKVSTVCKSGSEEFISETYPKVYRVPLPNRIIVSNNHADFTKESLNYFRNARQPDEIVSIKMLLGNRRGIITYKDTSLASEYSQLKNTGFEIKLYHDYENDNGTYKVIPLSSTSLLKFLMDQKVVVEDKLKDCIIPVWPESTGNLLKIMYAEHIEEKEIQKRVDTFLATIYKEQLDILPEIFEEVKETTQPGEKSIHVYFDNAKFIAHIFSFSEIKAADYLKKMMNTVKSKTNCREEIELEPYQISLLYDDFFSPKYKKVIITKEDKKLQFCGNSTDVNAIITDMHMFLSNISFIKVQFSRNTRIFKIKAVREYLQEKLKNNKCICAWEINLEDEALIYSSQKNDLQPAVNILKESIVDLNFPPTYPIDKIKQEKGSQFIKDLSSKYEGKFFIDINKIVTIDLVAPKLGYDFEKSLGFCITYVNTFPLKHGIYHYLKAFRRDSINDFCQKYTSTISFEDDQTLHISGKWESNQKAAKFLQSLIEEIKEKKHIFPHFGFKTFLQTDTADAMLKNLSRKSKCIILKNEYINSNTTLEKTCQVEYASSKIILRFGDITELQVDAMVNAANKKLQHVGSGVARAIAEKGGKKIQEECDKCMATRGGRELSDGSVRVTTAGNLKCKYIIHAVGPVWCDGKNDETKSLSEAIGESLIIAGERDCTSIAFPAISTGLFKFPLDKATEIIVSNIKEYLDNNYDTSLKYIYLVGFTKDVFTAFHKQLKSMFALSTASSKENDGKEEMLEPSGLFLYSSSLGTIEQVTKEIGSTYTSQYFVEKDIYTEFPDELSHEEVQIIDCLQHKYGVKIEFKTAKITVSGYKENISTVTEEIQKLSEKITQKSVQWSYKKKRDGKIIYEPYTPDINHQLEQAYRKEKPLKLIVDNKVIVFDFTDPEDMCGYPENSSEYSVKIIRKEKNKGDPKHWRPVDGTD